MNPAKGRRYKQSLSELFPFLAKEWHPIKNGELIPHDVTPGSGKKAWWLCDKGHEWQEFVYHRTRGCGCPYCSGHRATEDNCLQTINPNLAKEWHPTKNGKLTPRDVTSGSGKKVWWMCSRGHEWQAVISSRTKGNVGLVPFYYCEGCSVWYNVEGEEVEGIYEFCSTKDDAPELCNSFINSLLIRVEEVPPGGEIPIAQTTLTNIKKADKICASCKHKNFVFE